MDKHLLQKIFNYMKN